LGLERPSPKTKGEFEFEKGAKKTTGGDGWADVWRRGAFAWEYKKSRANLDLAYAQVQRYAPALDNPPLLIVSDTQQIIIRTAFTGAIQERHDLAIEDLRDAAARDLLRRAFKEPQTFKPKKTRADLTEEAAGKFAALAFKLRQEGHRPEDVAHFVNRLVFCMFAEDVRLLPDKMFEKMVLASGVESFEKNASLLFSAMAHKGGSVGFTAIPWFNGGLFDDDATLPIDEDDLDMLKAAAKLDWSQIDASLLGTLFERGLDPEKRSQLGAHYTDSAKIMQIVEPVILRPLQAEWEEASAGILELKTVEAESKAEAARTRAAAKSGALTRKANKAGTDAREVYFKFLERLKGVRVLDPACGSGNFLNLALNALKDFEHRVNLDAEALGLERQAPAIGPECVLGIEINPYAAELARVSTWIAEIQWMRRNGFEESKNPILKPLGTIECRDAVLAEDGSAAPWPEAEFIVGNPPFLGNKRMLAELGEKQTRTLRMAWPEVPGGADLVAYWVAGTWKAIKRNSCRTAGLVTTNSIRGGVNRLVLTEPAEMKSIIQAWSDEPWTLDGASVRVSLVILGQQGSKPILNGEEVSNISADLTSGFDLTQARTLMENQSTCFQGVKFGGPFDVDGAIAVEHLMRRGNPNGLENALVMKRWINGLDLTQRLVIRWCIDFGTRSEADASMFEAPFETLKEAWELENQNRALSIPPKPALRLNEPATLATWWQHQRSRPEMDLALSGFQRYIVTLELAKHRTFKFMPKGTKTSGSVYAIARDDDTTFGILHSRFHEAWSLRMGTSLEDRPRYTPSSTFETFPFPEGLSPNIPAEDNADDPGAIAIAKAAKELNEKREAWLNPPDLVRLEPEVVEGFPDRIIPVDEAAEKELKKRTLTNLYNKRPTWLNGLHARLDAAVAAAYGWPADIEEEEFLAKLLELNLARSSAET